jgi:hypothetical protein
MEVPALLKHLTLDGPYFLLLRSRPRNDSNIKDTHSQKERLRRLLADFGIFSAGEQRLEGFVKEAFTASRKTCRCGGLSLE